MKGERFFFFFHPRTSIPRISDNKDANIGNIWANLMISHFLSQILMLTLKKVKVKRHHCFRTIFWSTIGFICTKNLFLPTFSSIFHHVNRSHKYDGWTNIIASTRKGWAKIKYETIIWTIEIAITLCRMKLCVQSYTKPYISI